MAQLTVRRLDPEVVHRLKQRAAANDRSAEAEHRAILEEVLRPGSGDFWARAARLRKQLAGRKFDDSARIIRKQRDRRTRAVG